MPAKRPTTTTLPKKAAKKTTASPTAAPDPTTSAALLALPPSYAAAPDIPVTVALNELGSLVRLARSQGRTLAPLGVTSDKIDILSLFGRRLTALEASWKKARAAVKLTAAQRKLVAEAEALDTKLLAGGRWGCRKDAEAQAELSRIAEGSGLVDTVQDLRDEVTFWESHEAERASTNVTAADLARATQLADELGTAAEKEAADVDSAAALDLRNRCYWASDELAGEIREGGRYGFASQPKIAAKFVSRYRASANRRARAKAKASKTAPVPAEKA